MHQLEWLVEDERKYFVVFPQPVTASCFWCWEKHHSYKARGWLEQYPDIREHECRMVDVTIWNNWRVHLTNPEAEKWEDRISLVTYDSLFFISCLSLQDCAVARKYSSMAGILHKTSNGWDHSYLGGLKGDHEWLGKRLSLVEEAVWEKLKT